MKYYRIKEKNFEGKLYSHEDENKVGFNFVTPET